MVQFHARRLLRNPPAQQQPAALATPSETAACRLPAFGVKSLLRNAGTSLPPACRLVALVPDLDLDESALSRRTWNRAAPNKLAVLYLVLPPSAFEEPYARRQLATLAALTRDVWVKVSTAPAAETDWVSALRPLQRRADLIVCHSEQTRPS